MYRNTKVATCNYCGTRAALVLNGDRHELVCSRCGAPLSELKSLGAGKAASGVKPLKLTRKPSSGAFSGVSADLPEGARKKKKGKKRKPMLKGLLEDIFDEIEDIFD